MIPEEIEISKGSNSSRDVLRPDIREGFSLTFSRSLYMIPEEISKGNFKGVKFF